MKNQTYRMTMLFDFYGEVLTERQKEFFDLYYNEDLSLAEISENYGITRQGVRDVIVRAEAILTDLEDKTGLIRRFMAMKGDLDKIEQAAEELLSNRAQLSQDIRAVLTQQLSSYNIIVVDASMENLDFSDAFTDAVEAKQVAEQNLIKTKTEQEQAIVIAEAEAKKKLSAAEAEASAILKKAEAQAEANRQIAASLSENMIEYAKVEKWDGKLPTVVAGADANMGMMLPDMTE